MKTTNYKELKAFFFDLDNTTYDHNIDGVRESTYLAFKKLKEKNKILVLDTSRTKEELYNAPKELLNMFDVIITLAGSYIIYKDHIEINTIKKETVNKLIPLFKKYDLTYRYATKDGGGYLNRSDKDREQVFYYLYEMIPPIKEYENEDVLSFLFYADKEVKEKIFKELDNESYSDLRIAGEIYPDFIDKGTSMLKVGKYFGLESNQLCSFGDSDNDLPMLEMAGLSIGLKKCSENVKKTADYITDDISDEGLYNALIHFKIID